METTRFSLLDMFRNNHFQILTIKSRLSPDHVYTNHQTLCRLEVVSWNIV